MSPNETTMHISMFKWVYVTRVEEVYSFLNNH